MHGGLEDGKPNKGPYGIPNLQGDLGGQLFAPAGGKSGDAIGKGGKEDLHLIKNNPMQIKL